MFCNGIDFRPEFYYKMISIRYMTSYITQRTLRTQHMNVQYSWAQMRHSKRWLVLIKSVYYPINAIKKTHLHKFRRIHHSIWLSFKFITFFSFRRTLLPKAGCALDHSEDVAYQRSVLQRCYAFNLIFLMHIWYGWGKKHRSREIIIKLINILD